jgi:GTPase SAR1 family protein
MKKIKTCILGSLSVGKSAIILRIYENSFNETMGPTVGVDYKS